MSVNQAPVNQAPPVNEVVLAIGFAPEKLLTGPLLPEILGPLFNERGELQTAPPYVMPTEIKADVAAWSGGVVPFQIQQVGIEPRYWVISRDSSFVIQVQSDYLALNWRRRDASVNNYVHYDELRSRFVQLVGAVQERIEERDSSLVPAKAELTYINIIEPNELWSSPNETHRLFAVDFHDKSDYEQVSINLDKKITGAGGSFRGRIHVTLQPGTDLRKQEPRLTLNITARSSQLAPEGSDDFLSFLDDAHELANSTFINLLTPDARTLWGL